MTSRHRPPPSHDGPLDRVISAAADDTKRAGREFEFRTFQSSIPTRPARSLPVVAAVAAMFVVVAVWLGGPSPSDPATTEPQNPTSPGAEVSTSSPDSTAPTPSTATSAPATTSAPTTSGPPSEPRPARYVLAYPGALVTVEGEVETGHRNVPTPVSVDLVGESVVYTTVESWPTVWIAPADGSASPSPVTEGNQVEYRSAGVIRGDLSVLYVRSRPGEPDELRHLNLVTGSDVLVFSGPARRPDLTGERVTGFLGDTSVGGDRLVMVNGVGDATWLEWYDISGTPVDGPERFDQGTVLEVELSPDGSLVAAGVETSLHAGISTVVVADTATGVVLGQWDVTVAAGRNLSFDGQWVAVTGFDPGTGVPIAATFVDIAAGTIVDVERPAAVALDRG